jgi:hypothetical protein
LTKNKGEEIHIRIRVYSRRRGYFMEKLQKQSIVASSMMYVEFIACLDAAGQVMAKEIYTQLESGRLH